MGLSWPLLWWIISTLCIPVSLPYLTLQIIRNLKLYRLKGRLKGQVVLITGASSGLGEALAHQFYSAGCRIILASRRQKELERVRDDLLREHSVAPALQPVVITLDLSNLSTLPAAVEKAISIFGKIDILINNGGVSFRGSVESTKLEVDMQIMQINYFGQIALTKAVLPYMIKQGSGHIIAVSSIQGRIAIPFRSAYAASKHALQAFCDSLRSEVSRHNIDVLVVNPGYIQTSLSMNALTGTGQNYGVLDETTASGYSAEYVAREILHAAILCEKEVTISSAGPKFAMLLRTIYPRGFFWLMKKRATAAQLENVPKSKETIRVGAQPKLQEPKIKKQS